MEFAPKNATYHLNVAAAQLPNGVVFPIIITAPASNEFLRFNGTDWVNFDLYATANTFTASQTFNAIADSILVAQRITHAGDTNTFIEFTSDLVDIVAGGITYVRHSAPALVSIFQVNPNQSNLDYQISGEGEVASIYHDASTDRLGLGTSNPAEKLHVATGNARVDNRLFHHDYASVTTLADSNAQAGEFDVFDEDNYSLFSSTNNVTARGITFTSSDGRFTVDKAGIFQITINFILNVSANSNTDITIQVNGADIYTHLVRTHAGVDPAVHSITIIKLLAADDFINFLTENVTGANTTTAQDGTTATIIRIS